MVGLYDIKKSYDVEIVETTPVNKALDLKTLTSSIRPMTDDVVYRNRSIARWSVSRFGFNFINLYDLWALSQYADILQNIFNARKSETFRNGFDISPIDEESSEEQNKDIGAWIKKCNNNNQSLMEVFMEFLQDLDWADDAYLLCSKNYHINENKEIIGAEVEEFIRLNPLTVEMVMDKSQRLGYFQDQDASMSKKAYFKLRDRSELCYEPVDVESGLPNLQAHYKVTTSDGFVYYNSSEVLHKSLHNPSMSYGFSPLFSLYPKVLILITQDDFIRKYYGENKPPKGFLVFNTDNAQGLSAIMDQIREKSKQNPHEIFPIPFQTKDGRKPVEYVDMSRTLQEMQFTENRNEFRNQIGAVYGVSPIFQNDMSTSGGLNNEGLQITITNRAVEKIQHMFNEYVLPFVFNQNLGFTQWKVTLNPSEEEDEAFKLDLERKELENIKLRLEMGQTVTQDKNGKFNFEAGELKLEQPSSEFIPFSASNDKTVSVETEVPITKSYIDLGEETIKAEYQGKEVQLNKPFRTPNANKKFAVYVKDGDKVKLVRFGSSEMEIKRDDPEARRSFRARMKCDTAKDKTTPRYWSCRMWSSSNVSDIVKKNPLPTKEIKQFETYLEKELDKLVKGLDLKKRPTKKELEKQVKDITNNMNKQLKAKSANRVKSIYNKTLKKVSKEQGEKFTVTAEDKNVIDALKKNPTFQDAFKDASKDLSKNLTEIIEKAYQDPKSFTIDNLVKQMSEQTDMAENKLRQIARTESTKISLAARKTSYQKQSDFNTAKFMVIGPNDNRTGEDSKRIVKQVGKGKTWDEIVRIIQKNAGKGWTVDKDFPLPRPNWRHSIVKVVD